MKVENLLKTNALMREKVSNLSHKRFIFKEIYLERPFKSLLGLRGVGKTTLLLQLANHYDGFYINLDDPSLKDTDLVDIFIEINKLNGSTLFLLDEIQSLENWEYKIKNVFEMTEFNVILSGSSLMNIVEKSIDLSRRLVSYEVPPLSFREYLLFKKEIDIKKIEYDDLFDTKKMNSLLSQIIPHAHEFKDYLEYGAYPFSIFDKNTIDSFKNILNKTLYQDFVKIRSLSEEDITQILKILKYIAQGSDEVSFTSISSYIGISKTKVISFFDLLEKSMLVVRVEPKVLGKNLLKKHPKYSILLPIRSLINSIYGFKSNIGDLREDMFITSLFYKREDIFFLKGQSKTPDFYVNGITFEIGGSGKTRKQLKGIEKSYLVKDVLVQKNNEIPLILFGFLY
jgi:predicted AAA+ superfamily ATPase